MTEKANSPCRADANSDGDSELIDARIRRRFRSCVTLPLFPDLETKPLDRRAGHEWFFADVIGRQLRLEELSTAIHRTSP